MIVVKPQHGPTLAQLLARLPRGRRVAIVAAAGLAVAVAAVAVVRSRPDEMAVLVRAPVTFNLAYGPQFERVSRPGALLALRHSRGGLFLDSYVVRELVLPRYRGAASGILPVYAFGYLRELRRRYPGAELVDEGRARINNGVGYQVVLRARLGRRTLYVRHLLLVEELPEGQRRGLIVELESTPVAGTPTADATGTAGALKTPLRSLRFGEDRAGGTA